MRWLRLSLKIIAWIPASVVGGIALLFAGLQTEQGQEWLAALINQRLSGEARISGLNGSIPWDMSIAWIELRDADGIWARIDRAVCTLRLGDLLHGRLTIAELGAARITVDRRPQPSSQRTAGQEPTRIPIPIDLRHLDLPSIQLAAPVLGRPIALALAGDATIENGRRSVHLAFSRIDGQPGRIDAAISLSGLPVRLGLAVDAEEPTGTLLDHLLSRADHLPFSLRLVGDGPLSDWRGRLDAEAGAAARLGTTITLSNAGGYRASIDGLVAAGALLPPTIRPVVGNDARLHLAGGWQPNGNIRSTEITLSLAAADLTGSARLGTGSDGPMEARLNLSLSDLSRLSDLLGQPLAGSCTIAVTAAGIRAASSVTAEFDGHNLRLAGRAAENVSFRVAAKSEGDLTNPQTPVTFSADGRADGLRAEGLPAAYRTLDWRASGSSTVNARRVRIDSLAVVAPDLTLTAAGTADRNTQTLSAVIHLAAADLSPLGAIIGQPLSGRARMDGTVEGGMQRPQLDAELSAEGLKAGAAKLDQFRAHIRAAADPEYSVRTEAEFRSGSLAGNLTAQADINADGKGLAIPRLHLAAGGTTVDAVLRTALDTHLTSGWVKAHSPNLSAFSGLLGAPLTGRLELNANLAARKGQQLTVDLSARQLSLPVGGQQVTAESIAANARMVDLLGAAAGHGDIAIRQARVGTASIQRLDASAHSRRAGDFAFATSLQGQLKAPVALAAAGEVKIADNAVRLRIASLDGSLGHEPLHLEQPLRIARSGQVFSLANLQITVGSGLVSGSGSLTARTVTARLEVRNFPLAMGEAFAGGKGIGGTLDATAELHGPVEGPAGILSLSGHGLRLPAAGHAPLPATELAVAMRLRPGRVDITGRVAGPKGEAIDLTGTLPIRFSPHPFGASIPRQEQISLRIRGDGRLEDWVDLLPIGADRISGHYHLDLVVAGTAATPAASGHVTLDHGRYENLTYGTVLDAITVDLQGNRDRITLSRFTADDGHGGKLGIEGAFLAAAPAGPALDATLTLNRFRFVHTDDAVAHGSGQIRVTGAVFQPDVVARLNLDDAQLYLAERLPPSVRTLAVTVIDSKTGEVLSKPPPPSQQPALVAALDVQVNIPGPFFVRGRGLDSQWQGRITVAGTSKSPDIRGSLQLVTGTMNFLGKTLELTRGTITLVGGSKIEPLVDILAQSSSAQISAQVEVTGPAEHPKIKLTSQPPMPQDQILSQLLFGADVTQLTPLEGLQIAQAAADLASGGPGVIDRIRMKFGLDRLNIGSSQQGLPEMPQTAQTAAGPGTASASSAGAASALGSTMVSAGKYVIPGVFVGVGQGISGDSQVNVQVEVTRHITVDGTESTQQGTGVGVSWKLDY